MLVRNETRRKHKNVQTADNKSQTEILENVISKHCINDEKATQTVLSIYGYDT